MHGQTKLQTYAHANCGWAVYTCWLRVGEKGGYGAGKNDQKFTVPPVGLVPPARCMHASRNEEEPCMQGGAGRASYSLFLTGPDLMDA